MQTTHPSRWLLAVALAVLVAGCGRPGSREFASGVKELKRGRAVRAKDLFDKSIRLRPGHPSNAEAYNYLGMARNALGEVDAAARAFEEGRRLNPEYAAPSYNLGCLHRSAGDAPTALAYFAEASRLDPADARPLEMMGRIHASQKRWNEAAATWQAALERAQASPRILSSLAEVELQRHGPHAAVQFLAKSLEADKRYAPALYNLYVIHAFALGNPGEGEPYARQFLESAGPDNPRAVGVRAWLAARRNATPGPSTPQRPASGESTRSAPRAQARPAVTAAPPTAGSATTTPAEPAGPAAMLDDARRRSVAGNPAAALALCLQAADMARKASDTAAREKALRAGVELAVDLPDAHLALGRFLLDRKDADAAARCFTQALTLAPNHAAAHVALAEAAIAADNHDTAVVSLRKALHLRRDDPEARWLLATLYDTVLGLKPDAAREYREFAGLFPQDPRALTAGERLRALQPPDPVGTPAPATVVRPPPSNPAPEISTAPAPSPALPVSTGRRIEFHPSGRRDVEGATAAFNRGYGYHRRGDLDRAVYDYLRAVDLDNRYVLAFYNLGDVYRQRGDLDLARDAYSRAMEISPEDGSVRYNLALVLDLLGETTAAQQQLRFILARQPEHPAAHYMLGLLYARDARTAPAARAHLIKFIELQPSDSKAAGVRQWLAEHP